MAPVSGVNYQKHNRIARVTLCRPEAMNAIDRAMNDRLIEIWRDFEADPEMDIAILTGEGSEAFCAGADLKDFIPEFLDLTPRDLREKIRQGLGGITRGLHRVVQADYRGRQRLGTSRRIRARPRVRPQSRERKCRVR